MIEKSRVDRLGSGTATIGLIFNPLSGRIRKRKDAIRRALTEIPGATCREVTNAHEINASVGAFIDAGVDLLVIVGGDGTLQGVLCHLFATQPRSSWPILAVVPGGTTNMTALDLGILGDPESVLQKLRNSLLKQAPPVLLQRHVLCIEQTGVAKIYGMFFGVGLIARAVIFSQSRIKKLGITGEIYAAIITPLSCRRTFRIPQGSWAPVKMSIIEGNAELNRGAFAFLFASTLDRLLFGMRPYWGQEQEPCMSHSSSNSESILRSLLQLLSGHGDALKEKNGYYSRNTQALELLVDDVYVVDGESYRAAGGDGPLRITAAGPVSFLAPEGVKEKP